MSMGAGSEEEVGLWRRMLARAQQGDLSNHSFFHIRVEEGYLQSSLFCILSLPPVFMEHYRKRLKEKITLEGADGKLWATMLGLQFDSQQYCLNIGWREFAQHHNLALNDQLVFLLFEDSHFLVQVFDAENNFKGRVKPPSSSLAEKPKDVPLPRGNTFLDRKPKEMVIDLPDSDGEDEHIKAASGIKMRPKQTVARPAAPPGSRSPPSSISPPSSPEPAPVLKRARKLRGYDEDEDFTPGTLPAESEEAPSTRPKRDAALSKANVLAEMMAAEATPKKPPKKKAPQESPPKGMKKQPVSARPKVKVQKKKRPATPTPPPSPPPPPPPPPEEVTFKRPAKAVRVAPELQIISKRRPVTDLERKETLEKAQEYVASCKNRHFLMQLRVQQVYCGFHLAVTRASVEALGLPLRNETMTFYDVTGKTWEVEWRGDHPQMPGFLNQGWTKFSVDHCLEEGDVCVFELPDPNQFNISVTIFPIVPLEVIPEITWKTHYLKPRSPGNEQHKFAVPAARSPPAASSPVNNTPPPSPSAPSPPVEAVAASSPAQSQC